MTVLITHSKVSTIPDTDDTSLVRPSDWNADHVVVGAAESGANTDITSLSGITGGISSPDYIQFDTTYATPLTEGQLGWDGNDTLAVGMAGGNVIQHIGEDSFIYIKADSAITKGQVIMFTGAVGASGVLTGAPATGVTNPQYIMGIAAESIAHNGFGLVQNFGELSGLNTNAFNEGDVLYYDSTVVGGLTNVFPTSGPIVLVAAVAKKAGGNGTLVIRVSVTQRITGGSGATITQTNTGTTVAVTNPYNPASVAITGGTINGTTIGATTPAAGTFTTITGQTEVLRGTGNNLIRQSQALATSPWFQTALTSITNNTLDVTDPLGGNTATKAVAASSSASVGQNIGAIGGIYTYSVYARCDTGTLSASLLVYLSASPFTGILVQNITLTTSWQRFAFTTTAANGSSYNAQFNINTGGGVAYIWGAQLEIGNTANTYIPTTTTAVYGTPTLSFSGVSTIGLEQTGALYLQPAGTGAIQAQATDSGISGGNARGANAVDWQTNRASATRVASGSTSTVSGGSNNGATGSSSTVGGGASNTSTALQSFVGGGGSNQATGVYSAIAGGNSNIASGYYGFIGGGNSNSTTSNSAVTTQSGTMNGTTAVTLSGSNASIKVGQYITGTSIATNTYVAAISGTSLTLSQAASGSSTSTLSFFTPHGVVVGGGNNQATGSYSFIGGGGDAGTAANRNTASGDWSVVCGGMGNTASASGSFVGGGGNAGSGNVGNTASGVITSILGGQNNTASSYGASVLGGRANTASGNYSVASGYYATTRGIQGIQASSACQVPIASSLGVSQSSLLILGKQTTDATATVITSDGGAAGTTNQVILPNNSAYYFRGEIIAGVTGGGNTKGWFIEGVIKRGANAASTAIVGTATVTSNYADAGASTWAVTATADTTNGGLRITVTGQAATTIRWVAQIRTTEMTY
jgi:hypothetical protein